MRFPYKRAFIHDTGILRETCDRHKLTPRWGLLVSRAATGENPQPDPQFILARMLARHFHLILLVV
jgi:hypothetical protein